VNNKEGTNLKAGKIAYFNKIIKLAKAISNGNRQCLNCTNFVGKCGSCFTRPLFDNSEIFCEDCWREKPNAYRQFWVQYNTKEENCFTFILCILPDIPRKCAYTGVDIILEMSQIDHLYPVSKYGFRFLQHQLRL
jgi:hypothetical protein